MRWEVGARNGRAGGVAWQVGARNGRAGGVGVGMGGWVGSSSRAQRARLLEYPYKSRSIYHTAVVGLPP